MGILIAMLGNKNIIALLLGVFLLAPWLLVYSLWSKVEFYNSRPAYSNSLDNYFVNKSYERRAASERRPVSEIIDELYPVSIHLKDKLCIQLRPTLHFAGGEFVYCFDQNTKSLLEEYQI